MHLSDPLCHACFSFSLVRTSGIGKATAYAFAREGCNRIVLADMDVKSLLETTECIRSAFPTADVHAAKTDISDAKDVESLLAFVIGKFGRVDYACNAAGILGAMKRSHELDIGHFDRMLSVNYRGAWLCSREELKYMLRQEPLPTHDGRPGNRG